MEMIISLIILLTPYAFIIYLGVMIYNLKKQLVIIEGKRILDHKVVRSYLQMEGIKIESITKDSVVLSRKREAIDIFKEMLDRHIEQLLKKSQEIIEKKEAKTPKKKKVIKK